MINISDYKLNSLSFVLKSDRKAFDYVCAYACVSLDDSFKVSFR